MTPNLLIDISFLDEALFFLCQYEVFLPSAQAVDVGERFYLFFD
jgi:hypothetical protein